MKTFLFLILLGSFAANAETRFKTECSLANEKSSSSLSFDITILEKGFYIHPDAPLAVELTKQSGIKIDPAKMEKSEAKKVYNSDKKLSSLVFKKTSKISSKQVSAEVKSSFFLCSAKICEEQKNLSTCKSLKKKTRQNP